MSHLCCRHCRVRFTAEAAPYLAACPECERPTGRIEQAQDLLGFRLFDPLDLTDIVDGGLDLAPAQPSPRGRRS
jgi:hypothetical protein